KSCGLEIRHRVVFDRHLRDLHVPLHRPHGHGALDLGPSQKPAVIEFGLDAKKDAACLDDAFVLRADELTNSRGRPLEISGYSGWQSLIREDAVEHDRIAHKAASPASIRSSAAFGTSSRFPILIVGIWPIFAAS